jgi:hypothetical protein
MNCVSLTLEQSIDLILLPFYTNVVTEATIGYDKALKVNKK